MPSLIRWLTRLVGGSEAKRLALEKRTLERQLQNSGMTRAQARRAVAARYERKRRE